MSEPSEPLETVSDLVNYIVAAGENGAVDAKGPMKWDDAQAKAALAHDIAAFANSEGGGAIVIGKSQLEDNTFELIGLSADDASSFDTAAVASWVNSRFEPPIDFTCYSVSHEDKTFVVIKVREFLEIPSICTKECVVDKKRLLEFGALYVRTKSGSSTKLQTRDQLAELISRAVVKQQDQLREIFDRVLSGRSAENKPTDEAQYGAASLALFDQLRDELEGNSGLGGWQVTIHGESFERRWNTVAELIAVIDRHKVDRWQGFPQRFLKPLPTEWGITGSDRRCAWGLTYEGLFCHYQDFEENHRQYKSRWTAAGAAEPKSLPPGKWTDPEWSIYHICMAIEFAARYAAEFEPGSQMRLNITAPGISGRQFLASNPTTSSFDIGDADGSKAKSFPFATTVTAGKLQANWREIAIDCAYQFVQLFPGGMGMSRDLVGKWVAKYLGETVHW